MEYLAEHPVLLQGLAVWARCFSCGHQTELVRGYYCRCGYDGWSLCRCTAEVVKPVAKTTLPHIPHLLPRYAQVV